jgi:signal peptidase II
LNVRKILKRYLFLVIVTGLILVIDQTTKAYIRAAFPGPEGSQMWAPWDWLLPYARIVHVTNTGVAFGLFQNMGGIFAILATIVALAIFFYFPQVPDDDWVLRLSMSMMLGGAVGNLIDRVTNDGKVTDFISVGSFPVFNVADASITVGVIILMIGMWIQENRQKHERETERRLQSALESESTSQDHQPQS